MDFLQQVDRFRELSALPETTLEEETERLALALCIADAVARGLARPGVAKVVREAVRAPHDTVH